MTNGNKNKTNQLGMSTGKANNILKKSIMFLMAQKLEINICYRCNKEIETVNEFSIEHKDAWQDSINPLELYFDLKNIAFSHLKCNISSARRKQAKHPSEYSYRKGCRCIECTKENTFKIRKYRKLGR